MICLTACCFKSDGLEFVNIFYANKVATLRSVDQLLDWAGPGQRQVADACECGNEPSGSVKCGEFLD